MQNTNYLSLWQDFDAHFPYVKELVINAEQFYDKHFDSKKLETNGNQPFNLADKTLVGYFKIVEGTEEAVLPPLKFEKTSNLANPYFYLVVTPEDEIIYIGSSLDDVKPKSCSVSALTGGILPKTNSKTAYKIYLGILSAVRKYGSCDVYQLNTGYENIKIKDLNGDFMTKKKVSREFAETVNAFIIASNIEIPILNTPEYSTGTIDIDETREEIWKAVSVWGSIIGYKLEAVTHRNELAAKKCNEEGQEITITQDGLNNITFTFKNKVELLSPDEFKFDRLVGLEKVITPSARILCQTGDTVYEQYTSYIAHKVKNGAKDQNVNPVPLKQTALYAFEKTFIEHSGANEQITFKNIFLGNLQHDPGLNSRSVMSDGGNSAIELDFGKTPSLKDIKDLTYALETLFGLDPNTTKVTLAF